MLFERFVSPERKEPPDIDVDFEHERREEVIQYIYARYGRDRAGLAATVISYRARSAVRDVGKAMGLSEDTVSALAGMVWGTVSGGELPEKHVRAAGLDPKDPLLSTVLELTHELMGFPRHLSQHVGGFVLTRGPLIEVVPVGNAAMDDRTFIEWDKDDIAALGLLKVDVLALGMLTCIRKAFDLIKLHEGKTLTLATVPREDSEVYDMLCRADSIGVFQVESRAQMNMLPRLKPRCFYDLVIEVAIVRPGPIQGDMVHPYLRRRDGVEAEHYPSPAPEHGPKDELRNILGKTKGVPLFQEQAMRIALVAAKFSDAEVNELRKAMATFRRRGTIGLLEEKMVSRMVARGYDQDFAQRCFNQIKGFGEYGFPESHAASFAHLVYVSSWIKCHHPAAFAAALMNSQPMGFYAPAQIVRDAREHAVEAREADVNLSDWDCTLEAGGVRRPAGSAHRSASDRRSAGRGSQKARRGARDGQGAPVPRCARPVGAGAAAPDQLGEARRGRHLPLRWPRSPPGSVGREGAGRRRAAATVRLDRDARSRGRAVRAAPRDAALRARRERLPDAAPIAQGAPDELPARSFAARRVLTCDGLRGVKDGAYVAVAGVVLVRQRPGSAKGVVFMTIEDETGVANAVVWPKTLERFRKEVMGARLIVIHGRIQRHEDIIHVVSAKLEDRSDWLQLLSEQVEDMKVPRRQRRPRAPSRHPLGAVRPAKRAPALGYTSAQRAHHPEVARFSLRRRLRQHLGVGHALGAHEHGEDAHGAQAGIASVVLPVDGLHERVPLLIDARALGAVVDRDLAFEDVAEHRHVVPVPAGLLAGLHGDDRGSDFRRPLRRIGDRLPKDRLRRAEQRQDAITRHAALGADHQQRDAQQRPGQRPNECSAACHAVFLPTAIVLGGMMAEVGEQLSASPGPPCSLASSSFSLRKFC